MAHGQHVRVRRIVGRIASLQACPAFPCTIKDKQNKTQQLMEELAIIRHKLNSFEEQSHAGTQMPIHVRATAISFRLQQGVWLCLYTLACLFICKYVSLLYTFYYMFAHIIIITAVEMHRFFVFLSSRDR